MRDALKEAVKGRLRRAAALPVTAGLVGVLDLVLWPKLPRDVRERLAGHRVELVVRDRGLRLAFAVTARGFVPRPGLKPAQLTISAAARDFAALAAGDEDADTLYFSRRLVVEGDTETALMVKNAMDALEVGGARKAIRRAHRIALGLRARREARAARA